MSIDRLMEKASRDAEEAKRRARVAVGATVNWIANGSSWTGSVVHASPASYGQALQVVTPSGEKWLLRASEVEVVGG